MFNCTIFPRNDLNDGKSNEYVHIFRCAAMPPRYLVDQKIPSTKNHFVTSCQPTKALRIGERNFKPRLPVLLNSAIPVPHKITHAPTSTELPSVGSLVPTQSQSPATPAQCNIPHAARPSRQVMNSSPSQVNVSMKTSGTKRKQISLDVFLPKEQECKTLLIPASQSNIPRTTRAIPSANPNTKRSDCKTLCYLKEKPACTDPCPDDVYNYVNLGSSLPDSEKYRILCSHWKPASNYSFPPDEKTGRRFQFAWLKRFPWLAYSAVANGGFCVNCLLFGSESTHNASKLQRLMTSALPPSASAVQKRGHAVHVNMGKSPMFMQWQPSAPHSLNS